MNESRDHSTLRWLKGEIDETIRRSRLSLEEFVESDEQELMTSCAEGLHQVYGILQMVELYGASMLAEELELVALALQSGSIRSKSEAAEALMMGMIRLPDYLEKLQSGGRDNPIIIMPMLNDLRASRDGGLLTEIGLLSPQLDEMLVAESAWGKPSIKLKAFSKAIRPRFQRGLLDWIRGTDVVGGLESLQKVMEVLERNSGKKTVQRMFRIARASLVLPLVDGAGTGTVIKRLFGQVDRQIRRIVDEGEGVVSNDPPLTLMRNLLYYVAVVESKHELLVSLKEEFNLYALVDSQSSIDSERQNLTAPSLELLKSLQEAISEDLTGVKDGLDMFIRTGSTDIAGLSGLESPLRKVGDTLGMVGQGALRQRLIKQAEKVQESIHSNTLPNESELMAMAGDILFVEASLENLASASINQQSSIESIKVYNELGEEEKSEPGLELPAGEFENLLKSVVHEVGIDMRKSKDSILTYIETPSNIALLDQVPGRFRTIAGALEILKLFDASGLLRSLASFFEKEIIDKALVLNTEYLNVLADAIASIEYFMETLVEGRGVRNEILDIARESMLQLEQVSIHVGTVQPIDMAQSEAVPAETKLDDIDPEILEIFLEEAKEELGHIKETFPKWQLDRNDEEALLVFRRAFHTLKGSGRLVGAQYIAELAWSVENLLNHIIDESVPISANIIRVLGLAVEALPELITAQETGVSVSVDFKVIIEEAFQLSEPEHISTGMFLAEDTLTEDATAFTGAEDIPLVEDKVELLPSLGAELSNPFLGASAVSKVSSVEIELEEIDPEILDIFIEEAQEESESLKQFFPRWKLNLGDKDALVTMRRSFHTLKGSGRLVGALIIGELSWSIENLLNQVIEKIVVPSNAIFQVIEYTISVLPELIDAQEKGVSATVNIQSIIDRAFQVADPNFVDDVISTESREIKEEASELPPLLSKISEYGVNEKKTLNLVEDDDVSLIEVSIDDDLDFNSGHQDDFAEIAMADIDPDSELTDFDVEHLDTGLFSETSNFYLQSNEVNVDTDNLLSSLTQHSEQDSLNPSFEEVALSDDSNVIVEEIDTINELLIEDVDSENISLEFIDTSEEMDFSLEIVTSDDSDRSVDIAHEEIEELESVSLEKDIIEIDSSEIGFTLESQEGTDTFLTTDTLSDSVVTVDQKFSATQSNLPELVIDEKLLEIFSSESNTHLKVLKEFSAVCKELNFECKLSDDVFRAYHTLHGSAHMANVEPIAMISAKFETYLKNLTHQQAIDHDLVALIIESVQVISVILATINRSDRALPDWHQLLIKLDNLQKRTSFSVIDQLSSNFPEEVIEPIPNKAPMASVKVTIDDELIEIFVEEAEELLDDLDKALLTWGKLPEAPTTISHLLRTLHTLKGSARLSGITPIGDLSHAFETLLDLVLSEKIMPSVDVYTFSQNIADALLHQVEDTRDAREVSEATDIIAKIDKFIARETNQADSNDIEMSVVEDYSATQIITALVEKEDRPLSEGIQVDIDDDLIEIFLEEATDLLESLDRSMHEWGDDINDLSVFSELERTLHTLKGSSRLTGVMPVGDLSHAFESLLFDIKQQKVELTKDVFHLSQRIVDRLLEQIDDVRKTNSLHPANDLLDEINAASTNNASKIKLVKELPGSYDDGVKARLLKSVPVEVVTKKPSEEKPTVGKQADVTKPSGTTTGKKSDSGTTGREQVRVKPEVLDNLVNNAGEIGIYRARLEQQNSDLGFNVSEMMQTVSRLKGQLRKLEIETEAQIISRYESDNKHTQEEIKNFDPLEMDQFSTMQQLSRSLMETVSDLGSLNDALSSGQRYTDTLLLQQSRISSDLQDGLMRTRMVPFQQVIPRLRRVIRQTSNSINKKAELVVEGTEAEIDRNILDRMMGPIDHLLRNSLAHGIESPSDRLKIGKSETGVITFEMLREGNDVIIEVSDDGAGLNVEAIREKAVQKGLLAKGARVSDEDIMQFVLAHGFSTSQNIDQVSGRGVGMDVVMSEVKQLGGSIHITSVWGQGAKFTIRLPLTLAVSVALLVRLNEEVFAVPHASIEGVVRIPREDLIDCYAGRKNGFDYAGHNYLVRYLGTMMGTGSVTLPEQDKWFPLLLVKSGDHRIGLQVDELLGNREIVVKSLGIQMSSVNWLTGGTILADGRVALILDVSALVRMDAVQTVVSHEVEQPKDVVEEKIKVMVVDDSITVRKVTSRLLKRHNMEVILAKDGVDAVAQLQDVMPDVMLLDVEMPRMDGYELARHVRNTVKIKHVPIIMITSRTGEKHRKIAMDLGVNKYLGKPFQEALLLESIYEMVSGEKV